MNFFEKEGILGELHGAYIKQRRLKDQVFVLKGICSFRKNQKIKNLALKFSSADLSVS